MRRVVSGCAVGLAAAALVAGVPAAGAEGAPPLSSTCGDAPGITAQPTYVRTADGVDLYALDAGTGSTAIVLVHESPANLCGWLPVHPHVDRGRVPRAGVRPAWVRPFGVHPACPTAPTTETSPRWSRALTPTGRSVSS